MRRGFIIAATSIAVFVSEVALAEPPDSATRLPMTITPMPLTHEVVVSRGDHLWNISERHLNERGLESKIAPYWRQVIETNLPTLRSGDPDLIYPGELVMLPDPDR